MSRLQNYYRESVVPDLTKKFGYASSMQVPRIEKITLNMGVGETVQDKKVIESAVADLTKIAGQKAVITKAKKSIATSKVRQGYPVGCMVTLRGGRMYEFLDRLIAVAMPRIRDFRGLSPRKFDGRGNYTFGVGDQSIFPEIELEKIKRTQGMDITLVTNARTNEAALEFLKLMGFPFAEK